MTFTTKHNTEKVWVQNNNFIIFAVILLSLEVYGDLFVYFIDCKVKIIILIALKTNARQVTASSLTLKLNGSSKSLYKQY